MAEARVVFTKSKMNKDLDERILTPGEYRDGFNISVSKSEGPDEGVVENVLGNSQLSNFIWNNTPNVDIIGIYEDTNSDRIFIFATNFTTYKQSLFRCTPTNIRINYFCSTVESRNK